MIGSRVRAASVLGILALVLAMLPSVPIRLAQAQSGTRKFPETGKTVGGSFLKYWTMHGGLAQQGYPISEEMQERSDTDGKQYTVQYFERAAFEYHPENRPPNDVLLSLLGNFLYKQKYPKGAPNQQPSTAPGTVIAQATGKRLGGKFLQYWQSHGSLPQQGYPISDEFLETSPLNGKTYRVQYFERAVFEMHPENKPPFDVLLSQLGTFRYKDKYLGGGVVPAPGDVDGDSIPDSVDRCPREPENINKILDTDGCPDTMKDLIDVAADDINNFWVGQFKEASIKYIPPTEIVPYVEPIPTACGKALLENAFYCLKSHGIYYDINFLQDQLNSDGDFAPVTIMAHEWGHLVQANLGILQSDHYTIQTELQADCFAGAWAADAGTRGILEEGDLDEGATSLFRAGDDLNTPWFDPQAHGQPDQRVASFATGLTSGVDGCFDK